MIRLAWAAPAAPAFGGAVEVSIPLEHHGKDSLLSGLPLPMPSLGIQLSVSADKLAAVINAALDRQLTWGIGGSGTEHCTEFSIAMLGWVVITTGRTTQVALS